MTELRNRIEETISQLKEEIEGISDYIFNHPELGDQEFESSRYLVEVLRKNGFDVTFPYLDIPTSFRAEFGDEGAPKIAYLPEYDALPGYGPEKKPAHACGHNWIAAQSVGTALVLAKLKDCYRGKIVVIGTPAEEVIGRKADLADKGAFDDIDAAMQMHLYETTNLKATALAMDAVEFEFFGKASHAAVHPEEGINALDAVNLTFAGVSFLRQQLQDNVRIHGIVTEGGAAPNIIPDHCKCLFYVRAARKSYFQKALERVKDCARGAAIMTGTELKINMYENAFDDLIVNPVLAELGERCMVEAGFEDIQQTEEKPGSTDLGNVSYRCPVLYANVGVAGGKAKVHEEAFLDHANGPEAKAQLIKSVRAQVLASIELFRDPQILKEARTAFEKAVRE